MASSSSSNPLISVFFFGWFFFFFFSEDKSFVSATREEQSELQHTHHHHVSLTSLLPSSSCTSPPPGRMRKGSLQVVHRHGPCHTSSSSFTIPHSEILKHDQARVRSIHAKLSKINNHHDEAQEAAKSYEGMGQAKLPAKSGSLLGTGNYFVTVGLGRPRRELSLIFDTGSDLTWTQCKPCARSCYSQKEPIFDPSQSSSYSNISCSSSQCSQLSAATGTDPGCSKSTGACIYGIQYGDSSFSVGYFAKETVTISPTDVVDNFLFGCGQNNEGLFGSTAGLLGLGRNPISFVEQTAQKYNKIFSYCIPSRSSTVGYLSFGGGHSSGNVKFTPLSSISRGSSFYGLDFTGITLAGVKLPIAASTFSPGTIIDSGTVITRLPPAAYGPLRDAFRKAMSKYPKADPVSILDTCYDLSKYKTFVVPKITLSFGGGVNVELDATGILYGVKETQVCLAFSPNKDSSSVTILGNVQQKTLEVVYDVGAGKIGFRPGGCI
ncbi:aspartyl protease family protein At5g10770 [Neltuma alba]|uniref:aspartyl protease family protein At5g10770 n=1 Tax=Neltuma alba TaxID=207710 RepID=UPI0010A37832|nr:aspartyl protease family protein At5g10770-like [Prosopis alba]